jgi:hypothetical protein
MNAFNENDPLAERIQRERDALDRDVPRADLWQQISARLESHDQGAGQQTGPKAELRAEPRAEQLAEQLATQPIAQPAEQPVRGRMRSLLPLLRAAAVLVVLSAVGLWLTRMDGPADQAPTEVALEEDLSPAADPMLTDPRFSELHKMESEYARLQKSKADLITGNPDLSPEDAQQAIDLIEDLENDYRQLRQELEAGADAEKVLEAMVRNYRQRIEVLERMSSLFKAPPPPPPTK